MNHRCRSGITNRKNKEGFNKYRMNKEIEKWKLEENIDQQD